MGEKFKIELRMYSCSVEHCGIDKRNANNKKNINKNINNRNNKVNQKKCYNIVNNENKNILRNFTKNIYNHTNNETINNGSEENDSINIENQNNNQNNNGIASPFDNQRHTGAVKWCERQWPRKNRFSCSRQQSQSRRFSSHKHCHRNSRKSRRKRHYSRHHNFDEHKRHSKIYKKFKERLQRSESHKHNPRESNDNSKPNEVMLKSRTHTNAIFSTATTPAPLPKRNKSRSDGHVMNNREFRRLELIKSSKRLGEALAAFYEAFKYKHNYKDFSQSQPLVDDPSSYSTLYEKTNEVVQTKANNVLPARKKNEVCIKTSKPELSSVVSTGCKMKKILKNTEMAHNKDNQNDFDQQTYNYANNQKKYNQTNYQHTYSQTCNQTNNQQSCSQTTNQQSYNQTNNQKSYPQTYDSYNHTKTATHKNNKALTFNNDLFAFSCHTTCPSTTEFIEDSYETNEKRNKEENSKKKKKNKKLKKLKLQAQAVLDMDKTINSLQSRQAILNENHCCFEHLVNGSIYPDCLMTNRIRKPTSAKCRFFTCLSKKKSKKKNGK